MALIKTIAEVKAVLRISSMDDDMSLPDVDQAQAKHIVPAIGEEIVTDITGIYASGGGTDLQKELIKKIQKPLAAFAYLDDIGIIHATINDRGVSRISTAEMPAAYRWEFEEVKNTLEDKALTGMEQLLEFLEKNKEEFPKWTSSQAYKDYHRFLVQTGTAFSKRYTLYQPLRTFQALKPMLELVEDMYIVPAIGREFKEELINEPDSSEETTLLLSLLEKAEAYLVVKHAIEALSVRISDVGFTVIGTHANDGEGDRQPSPDNLLSLKLEAADRDGQNYLKKAISFLNANASSSQWPTYFHSENYQDPAEKKQWSRENEKRKIFRF